MTRFYLLLSMIGIPLALWSGIKIGKEDLRRELGGIGRKQLPVEVIKYHTRDNHPTIERDADGFLWISDGHLSGCIECHGERWSQTGSVSANPYRLEWWGPWSKPSEKFVPPKGPFPQNPDFASKSFEVTK